jgi:hypothetical protein
MVEKFDFLFSFVILIIFNMLLLLRSVKLTANVLQLPEGRDFYHKTSFEKLMFH